MQHRIQILDLSRGVAVLGILLMNIRIFTEPGTNYFSPHLYGDYTGINRIWWDFQYFVADQKFLAIFSMLFGASTALICDGLARRGERVLSVFGRRILFLMAFGLIHAYLIWHGDILVFYALTSVIPFLFRNIGWRKQIAIGVVILLAGSLSSLNTYVGLSVVPPEVMPKVIQDYFVGVAIVDPAQIDAYRGSWPEQFRMRIREALNFHTEIYLNWGVFRVGGLMMLGLGLYRCGFLTGERSLRVYRSTAALGLILGFALVATGYVVNSRSGWAFPEFFFRNVLFNYWGSVLVAIGYISLLNLMLEAGLFMKAFSYLQAVGRTALSNYIFQSVACTAVVYGFGLYAPESRVWTVFLVLGVWVSQIVLSRLWLRSHAMGPLESFWRSLTYGR